MTCHHSGPDFSNGLGYLPGVSGKIIIIIKKTRKIND
jgi:hypothetical protein